jgi:hypothetical protein
MRRTLLILFFACLILLFAFEPTFAQCAMCKQTLENSEQATTAAKGMNAAILVLFLPPVFMFVGIFGLIYRYGKQQQRAEDSDSQKLTF